MVVTSVVVIADDLTGAADSAAAFARQGLKTLVLWEARSLPSADVLVFTTESRHQPKADALRRVRDVIPRVAALSGIGDNIWIYKKIDSTLRGHPGPELVAVMDGLGMKRALVAPAFPAQGRVTRGGRVYVHGAALADSPFGREVKTSSIAECFAQESSGKRIFSLPLAVVQAGPQAIADALIGDAGGIIVADAESEQNLEYLAEGAMLSGTRLLCGSAGLAGALMRMLARRPHAEPPLDQLATRQWQGRRALVIAASRHPQTVQQVVAAEAAGIPVIRPGLAWFQESAFPPSDRTPRDVWPEEQKLANRCMQQLAPGPLIITSEGLPDLPGQSEAITSRLAQLTRKILQHASPTGLVLTGGDAAMAVGRALDAEALWLHGELQPGIPWGTWVGGIADGMPIVTKAGGFGDDSTFVKVIGA